MIKLRNIPPAQVARLKKLLNSRSKKAKTSVSISADLLAAIDELVGKSHRSEIFERAVRTVVRKAMKRARHERELAILNSRADRLNAEARETLEYQSEVDDE